MTTSLHIDARRCGRDNDCGSRDKKGLVSQILGSITANPADDTGESSFGPELNGIELTLSNLASWDDLSCLIGTAITRK